MTAARSKGDCGNGGTPGWGLLSPTAREAEAMASSRRNWWFAAVLGLAAAPGLAVAQEGERLPPIGSTPDGEHLPTRFAEGPKSPYAQLPANPVKPTT
jgi:hypothetical protein